MPSVTQSSTTKVSSSIFKCKPKVTHKPRWRIYCVLLLAFLMLVYTATALRIGTGIYNGGPDEYVRYLVPKAISEGNLLPRGDDPSTTAKIGNYSYAYYPQLLGAYIQGFLIWVARILGLHATGQLVAARMCSVMFGVLGAYEAGACISCTLEAKGFHSERWRLLTISLVGFWPQYVFLSSYVNNDIIAVAGVGIVLHMLLEGSEKGWNLNRCVRFAIGIIVCALSYLDTYGFILVSIPFFIWSISRNQDIDHSDKIKLVCIAAAICAVTILPFFAICAVRYGDPLGSKAFEAAYRQWVLKTGSQTMHPYTGGLKKLFFTTSFVRSTLISYVGNFGYMSIPVPDWECQLFLGSTCLFAIIRLIKLVANKDSRHLAIYLAVLIASLITLILMVFRTITTDYQAQGRYILPTLIPLCVAAVLGLQSLLSHISNREQAATIAAICIMLISVSLCTFAWAATAYDWHGVNGPELQAAFQSVADVDK
jgi:hypothetical protein